MVVENAQDGAGAELPGATWNGAGATPALPPGHNHRGVCRVRDRFEVGPIGPDSGLPLHPAPGVGQGVSGGRKVHDERNCCSDEDESDF